MADRLQTRITGGEWCGRLITTPGGREVRPTQAMVRQALFNSLATRIPDSAFLDLFAGAGTVGFEALSRGAKKVTFVEKSRELQSLIRESAEKLGATSQCQVAGADVLTWLGRSGDELQAFDIAYVDPPYQDPIIASVLEALAASPPALVVIEHHRKVRLESAARLSLLRDATYGTTVLSFFERVD